MFRRYSTLLGDNVIEIVNNGCPKDPFKCFLLVVARSLHRITMLTPCAAINSL